MICERTRTTPPTATTIPPPPTPRDSQPRCSWYIVWMLYFLMTCSARVDLLQAAADPTLWCILNLQVVQQYKGTCRLRLGGMINSSHPALISLQPIPLTTEQLMWLLMQFLEMFLKQWQKSIFHCLHQPPPPPSNSISMGVSHPRQQGVGTHAILLCMASQQMASRSNPSDFFCVCLYQTYFFTFS